jgi:hypothetical protein
MNSHPRGLNGSEEDVVKRSTRFAAALLALALVAAVLAPALSGAP